jgi:hypothetical protein
VVSFFIKNGDGGCDNSKTERMVRQRVKLGIMNSIPATDGVAVINNTCMSFSDGGEEGEGDMSVLERGK